MEGPPLKHEASVGSANGKYIYLCECMYVWMSVLLQVTETEMLK